MMLLTIPFHGLQCLMFTGRRYYVQLCHAGNGTK
jgi:hypothetical protein